MKFLYCNHDLIKMHIAEALVMAGLPMLTSVDHVAADIKDVENTLFSRAMIRPAAAFGSITEHVDRGPRLGKAKPGSGHDCFLKGIVVTAVVTAPAYEWPQIQRYHFLDIISSQSKMHRITKMDIKAQCNDEVDDVVIDNLNGYINLYNYTNERIAQLQARSTAEASLPNDEAQTDIKWLENERNRLFRKIVNNAPQGLHLAAGIVTNYLQLKTMKLQRRNHKLEEWSQDFVADVGRLPYFNTLTGV